MSHELLDRSIIDTFLARHPFSMLFVTVSGAHLYGFASRDSDYDLRGCHIAPVREVLRLDPPGETYEVMDKTGPVEMDIVTHDVRKFFSLVLKKNGYVLAQIFSHLVIATTPEHEELKQIARTCITRHHHYHYFNFAQGQWEMAVKSGSPTVKGLLYTYRVMLAGIHLLRTGEVESNLVTLNDEFRRPYITDLIERKRSGEEKQPLPLDQLAVHEREYRELQAMLDDAKAQCSLPEEPAGREALSDLLVRVRMKTL